MEKGHGMKRDVDKTAAAGFLDARSFVRPDGRQQRHGKDMETLRRKVFDRAYVPSLYSMLCECEGECGTHKGRCLVSINWFTMELSHKVARSKGRDDSEAGRIATCSKCASMLKERNGP